MSCLKKAAALSFFIYALVVSPSGIAWSGAGHDWIARQASAHLSNDSRAYYQRLAAQLQPQFLAPPTAKRGGDALAYLARFPDQMRSLSLEDVFARYDADVPAALRVFANDDTANWHYHNNVQPAANASHCHFRNHGRLVDRLKKIDAVLASRAAPLSLTQEAILTAFAIHLIQDVHQPLHTFTRLLPSCKHDLGGNRYCVQKGLVGQCKQSLHRLWDGGFGVFESDISVAVGKQNTFSLEPKQWADESLRYYAPIYNEKVWQDESRGRAIVDERVAQAVQRLHAFLSLRQLNAANK